MHPYHAALCVSAVITAVCAGCMYAHAPRRRDSQMSALLLAGAAWWTMCQVVWQAAPDAASARFAIRLSSPGWLFIGPLVLHIYAGSSARAAQKVGRLLPALYAASGVLLVLECTTNLIIGGLSRTAWGWTYRLGPLFPVYYACVMLGVVRMSQLVWKTLGRQRSAADKQQQPLFILACGLPIVVTIASDVVFPALGLGLPAFGAISFMALGLIGVWSIQRFGYFILSPGSFADEILETLPDGVLLVGGDDGIRVANPGMQRLSGYQAETLLGMRWQSLLQRSDAADGPDFDDTEYELHTATGERIPVSVSMSDIPDRLGARIGGLLTVRDVRELAYLRSGVVQSARLAAVGELAAGVAHEINNPISFVRSNLNQLQAHWKTFQNDLAEPIRAVALGEIVREGNELIEESIEGVDRAAQIVRGIRDFAHTGSQERELANVNQLIENVLHMATSSLQSNVEVERYYEDVPRVLCAPQELKQVFVNLIVNAGHAVASGGTILIRTEAQDHFVLVHVEDDGEGIEPDLVDRIFDPFFTTKRVGEGTGLGLGIAYRIARAHGGDITVASNPGHGSCFKVWLPAHSEDQEEDATV